MILKSLSIQNYKSFLSRQEIALDQGFNLLIGSNNSGKTSILDCLRLDPNLVDPHRSRITSPEFGHFQPSASILTATLACKFSEYWSSNRTNFVALPLTSTPINELQEKIKQFIAEDGIIKLNYEFGSGISKLFYTYENSLKEIVSSNVYEGSVVFSGKITKAQQENEFSIEIGGNGDTNNQCAVQFETYRNRIYKFNALRRPSATCGVATTPILDAEATTLPYCINHLNSTDSHAHEQLCSWVNRIFPDVAWIQAPPNSGGMFDLICLPEHPREQRPDLAKSVSSMGAGIGNVIAILYVVLTSRLPQVIAIDEPNAFLHPRALRELLSILETNGSQHQYILTAHSADVLTAIKPTTITILELKNYCTTAKQVDHKELYQVRSELSDLGIRITDLHSKDRVLWVEGQTEEIAFPDLLRWSCPEHAAGIAVLRVEKTGTFGKKSIAASEVASIYSRLSESSALAPPMVCILLDGETKSVDEKNKATDESRGKLRFLDRRMIENYILNPNAIQAILMDRGTSTSIESIEAILGKLMAEESISMIDGASALRGIFLETSNAKVEFRKTRDTPALISWIIKNDPEFLKPLRSFLRGLFLLPNID
ncbi:ATP-dependent nuclease [Hydrogenophaga sp. RWCD_12]|uniref:ATP-dependent nuclease n=1 Tax=Hydrogenophaga sp. RWCD_12 TaxID=3391190 RepID=UPI00398515C0